MELTRRQKEAQRMLAGGATHNMLFGGSRSGKTFLYVRNIVMRACKAPGSRHCILRFRFNHVKTSIIRDTFPKVMELCFPGVEYHIDKTDWFSSLPNGSQIWFGGLDDKARSEKILGQEHSTIFLNECSQIPYSSVQIAITRLAQDVKQVIKGRTEKSLPLRMYYDCNPPNKMHWSYRLFIQNVDPETKEPLRLPEDYASLQINPTDNTDNLPKSYMAMLEGLSSRMRSRFLHGKFADANPNSLFDEDSFEKWRVLETPPDMVRLVVSVDPSGADEENNADNDAIGIVVAGIGTDGNGYLLEDCTVKAGPATWGKVATEAYDRHAADVVVGEANYGGAMVKYVIQTQRPRTPYKAVNATRGKVVRAEPISALYESGKIRHVGYYQDLEEELCGFSTHGYIGENSPNRADAVVWAFTELFSGIVNKKKERSRPKARYKHRPGPQGWMG